jgi:DNA (cytosine-5)-methyltransferase 1
MSVAASAPSPRWVPAPSGIYVPADAISHRPSRPTVIDLFCGCGGFSLGMLDAGFEVLAGLDNDPASAVTYLYNLGAYPCEIHYVEPADKERLNRFIELDWKAQQRRNKQALPYVPYTSGGNRPVAKDYPPVRHFWFGDIRRIDGRDMLRALNLGPGDVDCVVGGPPCQGFSTAGRRDVMDPRNSLVFEFARLVLELLPKTFVMENVPAMVSMVTPEGLPVLDVFCRLLADGGFGTIDALKRSLLASSGAGAALRTTPVTRQKKRQNVNQVGLRWDEEAVE